MNDLWNLPIGAFKRKHSKTAEPRGHAGSPGVGPKGETCGTCKHLHRREMAGTYFKCGLNRHNWTGGRASDVRSKDAACSKWEGAAQ